MVDGSAAIEQHLAPIFADHPTGAFVAIVRGVTLLASDVALLRAIAGMVAPGASDLNPAVNAIQTLVAAKQEDRWRIALF